MTTEKLERVQYCDSPVQARDDQNITGQEFEHDFEHYHDAARNAPREGRA